MLLIRADLRLDLERAQERERATRNRGAREIEMQGDLAAAAQVHAPGDMEEPRELGEPVAVRIRCDLRQLVAQLLRE